jgi:hypothetical protein
MISQGKPGCETQLLESLSILVAGDVLTLVSPEVVHLELEGQIRSLSTHFEQKIKDLKTVIGKHPVWSEIADTKQLILQQLDLLLKEKIRCCEQAHKDILELICSPKVSLIPLTPDILCRAKKRIIRGEMPRKSAKVDQDAAIVESLASYFAGISDPQPILLFCSENHSDFAVELNSTDSKDRRFALHPDLARDLPKTHYFTTVADLLQFDKGYESLPPLPQSNEIREALERRVERLGSECDFDLDSEEYRKSFLDLETLRNFQQAQQYLAEVASSLPDEIRSRREILVERIQSLLEQCRRCISWNDRSELKLSQWIDYVPESMIPYTSLSNLLKIEQSLRQYLSVHTERGDKEN